MTESKKQPAAKLEDGMLRIAIWEHTNKDGKAYYSITHERRYFDKKKDGWFSTTSLGEDDLLPMGELYQQAYRRIKVLAGAHKLKTATVEEAA